MLTIDLLLHPVRLRIVQALLDGLPLTTAQLRARMPDIAGATMYRHVSKLVEADVLHVVDERRVRGAVERTYQLHDDGVRLGDAARAAMTLDDHRRAFSTLVAGMLADFERYLGRGDADPEADRVTYQQIALWLTDEEMTSLSRQLWSLLKARRAAKPTIGSARRLLTVVAMPSGPD